MPEDVLGRQELATDPVAQFKNWLQDAVDSGLGEPTAMTVATTTREGRPSARIVLLKSCDANGFVFATNYRSRKGVELDANPYAALLFHWQPLGRQVRIEGPITRCTPDESDAIFHARPRPARVGAWASAQSTVIPDRKTLEFEVQAQERRLEASATGASTDPAEVPRPEHWGGYRLRPEVFEFWQGRESRLHDRFRFTPTDSGSWHIDRLAP